MDTYDPKKIESKWQKRWEETQANRASDNSSKEKFYPLVEFPYPSGEGMHVGHVRSYTAMDVIARKRRGEGKNVLYPMGWDAFGLPTENYAVKTGVHPAIVTKKNTDNFRRQLQMLGLSFDWSREINTTDPNYYKWTQWIFLRFFNKGLAYKAKSFINWCPSCKIGLANEESVGGVCERCGGPTEKREKEQWMLAITKYADRLDKDLDDVDYLPQIKLQQRNWIGKSEGAQISFHLVAYSLQEATSYKLQAISSIEVFTTRADTIFGATYLVVAPEHVIIPELKSAISNWDEVVTYIAAAAKKTDLERTAEGKEKTGVELKGVKAINPANGEEIPLFVADYVLAHYGTGAIMAVPAHDERDFEFAKKFNLPIRQVVARPKERIVGTGALLMTPEWKVLLQKRDQTVARYPGKITPFGGGREENETALDCLLRELKEEVNFIPDTNTVEYIGDLESTYQPGTFIAMFKVSGVHLSKLALQEGEAIMEMSVEEALADPLVTDFTKAGLRGMVDVYTEEGILINSGEFSGMSSPEAHEKITEKFGEKKVTYKLRDWVFSRQRYWGEPIPLIYCEKDKWVAVPDDELPVTLPDIKEFKPRDDGLSPLASVSEWVNTTCPACGGPTKRETDTMPNWAGSSWYYLRYTDPHNDAAFASKENLDYWIGDVSRQGLALPQARKLQAGPVDWYNGGMEHTTLHLLYSRFWHKFLFDEGLVPTSEPYGKRTSHGLILAHDGAKMSKSKGNVVNPDDLVERFGADSVRLYEMFMGPFDQAISWNTDGVVGMRRFVERVWKLASSGERRAASGKLTAQSSPLEALLHQTIKKVSHDIESLKMNTAVSSLMVLFNEMEKVQRTNESPCRVEFKTFVRLLAPFAPHVAEELWEKIGGEGSVHAAMWSQYDESEIAAETTTIVLQIDGKTRGSFQIAAGAPPEEVERLARQTLGKRLENAEVARVVYVPDRLVNFVLART